MHDLRGLRAPRRRRSSVVRAHRARERARSAWRDARTRYEVPVRAALEHGFGVEIERERGEASARATRGVSGGVAYLRRSSVDFVLAHAQTYDGVYV